MGDSMSTIINATTTNGVVIQPDNSGSLVLQTNSGTTALTIDTSQNITTTNKLASASMPIGSVLQVVNATYSTAISTTSTTLADTGLTATITPKFATSKILVLVHQNGGVKDGNASFPNNGIRLVLLRGASIITSLGERAGLTTVTSSLYLSSLSTAYLDSPATTSATTYKTQWANFQASGTIYLQLVGETSTITLMEIAG
jgi:hypothetical protein